MKYTKLKYKITEREKSKEIKSLIIQKCTFQMIPDLKGKYLVILESNYSAN